MKYTIAIATSTKLVQNNYTIFFPPYLFHNPKLIKHSNQTRNNTKKQANLCVSKRYTIWM